MINMTATGHKIILLVERPHMQNNLHQKTAGSLCVGISGWEASSALQVTRGPVDSVMKTEPALPTPVVEVLILQGNDVIDHCTSMFVPYPFPPVLHTHMYV